MLSLLFAAITAASPMGALSFPVSGNAACKRHFTDGMLALHSFMYDQAREAFVAGAKADPRCAMARWGEAMTYNHPLWGEDEPAPARAALAAVTDEAKLTVRERGFLRAARALFGEGDSKARLEAWLAATERLEQELPGDDEAKLQHALALIAGSDHLKNTRRLMSAAALALDVFERRPLHPGAAHYLIHACDTPDHAVLALPAARRYARIAPAASHALHMPSHIFVQLGLWSDVARSNEASWAASQREAKGKSDKLDWHSYSWLAASYLEQGQTKRAGQLLHDLAARISVEDHAELRFAYAMIVHVYLVEAGAWERAGELLRPLSGHLPVESGEAAGSLGCAQHAPGAAGATRYPIGLLSLARLQLITAEAAMRRGDEAAVQRALDGLQPIYTAMEPWNKMMSPSSGERRVRTEAALLETARAYHARSDATVARAAGALRKLAELGDPNSNGPAFQPPTEEWLGDLLLVAGKPAEARVAYDAALAQHPRLARALLGAARAARAAGDENVARERYAELAALWSNADPDRPDLAEVRAQAAAPAKAANP